MGIFLFANNIYAYVSYASSMMTETISLKFNDTFTVKTVAMPGYEFKGWKIFKSAQTTGTITGITQMFESYYTRPKIDDDMYCIEDEDWNCYYCDEGYYFMDWQPGNDMYYRYDCDVYAYAYYEPIEYTINFYYVSDAESTVDLHSSLYNGFTNWTEHYHINNYGCAECDKTVATYETIKLKFNEPLVLDFETYNLNNNNNTPYGYDFKYF